MDKFSAKNDIDAGARDRQTIKQVVVGFHVEGVSSPYTTLQFPHSLTAGSPPPVIIPTTFMQRDSSLTKTNFKSVDVPGGIAVPFHNTVPPVTHMVDPTPPKPIMDAGRSERTHRHLPLPCSYQSVDSGSPQSVASAAGLFALDPGHSSPYQSDTSGRGGRHGRSTNLPLPSVALLGAPTTPSTVPDYHPPSSALLAPVTNPVPASNTTSTAGKREVTMAGTPTLVPTLAPSLSSATAKAEKAPKGSKTSPAAEQRKGDGQKSQKEMTKAERRALQESQRAAKQAAKENRGGSGGGGGGKGGSGGGGGGGGGGGMGRGTSAGLSNTTGGAAAAAASRLSHPSSMLGPSAATSSAAASVNVSVNVSVSANANVSPTTTISTSGGTFPLRSGGSFFNTTARSSSDPSVLNSAAVAVTAAAAAASAGGASGASSPPFSSTSRRREKAPPLLLRDSSAIDKTGSKGSTELFAHLPQYRQVTLSFLAQNTNITNTNSNITNTNTINISSSLPPLKHIHPAIFRLGLGYADGTICGATARVLTLLQALAVVVRDYSTPPGKDLNRELPRYLTDLIGFLVQCRPLSSGMGNMIRRLKTRINRINPGMSDPDAKAELLEYLWDVVSHRVLGATKQIVSYAVAKIADGDLVLTYGASYVVVQALMAAKKVGKRFRVIVLDARPGYEGRGTLRKLLAAGIPCSYGNLNTASYVMKGVSKVFLGAAAVFSNGTVYSRCGTAAVAMVANAHHRPVMICCETFKFHDRVQLDSFTHNELGDPAKLMTVDGPARRGTIYLPQTSPASSNSNVFFSSSSSPSSSISGKAGEGEEQGRGVGSRLRHLNLKYDVMPAEFVTMIITEFGMIPSTSVPVVLRELRQTEEAGDGAAFWTEGGVGKQ